MVLVRKGRDLVDLCCEIGGVTVELRPDDLSLAGVFLPTHTQLALDSEVELLLRSPIGELSVAAQVVQVISRERAKREGRSAGAGLLFINLADDQRAFIGLTLDALLRSSRARMPERERAEAKRTAERRGRSSTPPASRRAKSQPVRDRPRSDRSRAVVQPAQSEPPASRSEPVAPKRDVRTPRSDPALAAAKLEARRPSSQPAAVQRSASDGPRSRPAMPPPTPAPPAPPAPRLPPAPSPEAQRVLAELEAELAALQGKPAWAILGLTQDADAQAAKLAFLERSRRCHPHAFARYDSPAVSRAATELFIVQKKALTTMQATRAPAVASPDRLQPKAPSFTGRSSFAGTPTGRSTGALAGGPAVPAAIPVQPLAKPSMQPGPNPVARPLQPSKHPSQPSQPASPRPVVQPPKHPSQPTITRNAQPLAKPKRPGPNGKFFDSDDE